MEKKVLDKLEEFVQNQRENGDTDLRTTLWAIRQLRKDPDYDING